MKYKIEFELSGLPKMTNAISNHWFIRKKEADKWKNLVALALAGQQPKRALAKASLVLTRCSSQPPDPDGLVSGFKHVIDGLVACGVLENDKYENIGFPVYLWEKVPNKQGKIKIKLQENA